MCSIAGCAEEVVARGWCKVHYYRWWRNGGPEVTKKIPRLSEVCVVDGCDALPDARDMCFMHYKRWQRSGDPGEPVALQRGFPCQICAHPDADEIDDALDARRLASRPPSYPSLAARFGVSHRALARHDRVEHQMRRAATQIARLAALGG